MISFEEASKIIYNAAATLGEEGVPLRDSPGRVLAADVIADTDMPPFDKSAMDGFACRREDLGGELEVVEIIKAGDLPKKSIGRGECSKIMTGGRVPEGADCVIMVEQVEEVSSNRIVFTGSKTAGNIAKKGEDIRSGQAALKKGVLIKPQHVAVMASAGCANPRVYKRPKVAVLNTGDEIVEASVKPEGTCIRNSNGPQLIAQIENTGAIPNYMGIVEDTPQATDKALSRALSQNDIVLVTGGVSAGDYDHVPAILKEIGVTTEFEKVAVKPGRPTVFGSKEGRFVFGLPGNPVSSFTIFELMVKPFIFRCMGYDYNPVPLIRPLSASYKRKKSDRIAWIPVSCNERGEVLPVDYHGSAHIHSLCFADGLMPVPAGVKELNKGDFVDVRQI